MIFTYKINETDNYKTIKHLLREKFEMSSRLILKLKTNKRILLNGKLTHINSTLSYNDLIEINMDFEEDNSNIEPTNIPLNIIYEDPYYIVINKPSNMAIHPSALHYNNSLSNGVKFYFDSINLKKKIRPVNRLDKDTSRISYFCKKRIYSRVFNKANGFKHF